MAERGVWEVWGGVVGGGEGERGPGGDGPPRLLHAAENGAAGGGEEERKEAGVGGGLEGCGGERGGDEGCGEEGDEEGGTHLRFGVTKLICRDVYCILQSSKTIKEVDNN